LGYRGRLHSLAKLVLRSGADLARDRVHSQCGRHTRACADHGVLRRSRSRGSLSRYGGAAPYPASALQRSRAPGADPARHTLFFSVRVRCADRCAAHASRFAACGSEPVVDRRLCRGFAALADLAALFACRCKNTEQSTSKLRDLRGLDALHHKFGTILCHPG
jgi:hypothetical protein